MIVRTFPVKKSSGPQAGTKKTCSAIEYLLNEKDWQDKPRKQKPEVLKTGRGGLEGLNQNILNNHREHTYTSGVLAFKDGEWSTMTPEKKEFVMQRFLDHMLPGEAQNRVPYAFIEHQGEIHFIISKAWELDNGKTLAFNADPPPVIKKGKKAPFDPSKDYKETLQEVLNYELGFNKVEHNPLSIHKSKTDFLPDGIKVFEFKKLVTIDMRKTIGRIGTNADPEAKITNRYELSQYISEKYNVECEFKKDRGQDYLLVKPKDNGKPCPIEENVRLFSPVFDYKSNYVEIAKEYNRIVNEKASGTHKLKENEYEEKLVKLEKGRRQKEAFNEKFGKKPLGRKHLYENVKDENGKTQKKLIKGKAQKLRNAKEALKNPNSPKAGDLKKIAPGMEQQQSKKPKEQVEDKVALIVEEIIAERKIDLKMDGETMKNDDKKQQQSLSKTVNSSNKNTAPANNNSSNKPSSNNNSSGSSSSNSKTDGTHIDIIQTITVKEIEFANLEKEVQEELSKNGVSDKYIKLKNQLMALRKEIDDLRKKANLPKDDPVEQQNKLSNPFALELKFKPPTD